MTILLVSGVPADVIKLTASWSTGNLLGVSAGLSAVASAKVDVSTTPRVGRDDAATAATDGWAIAA